MIDCYIKAYTWHGLRRYSAILNGHHLGPARTTMLVALADATQKGQQPRTVYDADTGTSHAIDTWRELGECAAPPYRGSGPNNTPIAGGA